ncbi:MAG: hypothetical protein ACXABY_05915 [Candidatus Thorarchaeota archaeon]|jgi:hypothetical protein
MKAEIHYRPYITEVLADGKATKFEVDVWLYLDAAEKVGQVVLELVLDDEITALSTVGDLQDAFRTTKVVHESL